MVGDSLEYAVQMYLKLHSHHIRKDLALISANPKAFVPRTVPITGLYRMYVESFHPIVRPCVQTTFMHGSDKLFVLRVWKGIFGLRHAVVERKRSSEHLASLPFWHMLYQ